MTRGVTPTDGEPVRNDAVSMAGRGETTFQLDPTGVDHLVAGGRLIDHRAERGPDQQVAGRATERPSAPR